MPGMAGGWQCAGERLGGACAAGESALLQGGARRPQLPRPRARRPAEPAALPGGGPRVWSFVGAASIVQEFPAPADTGS